MPTSDFSTGDFCGLFWMMGPGTSIYKLEHVPLDILKSLANEWLSLGSEGDYDCAIFSNNSDGILALRSLLLPRRVLVTSPIEFKKMITDMENVKSD